jgi:hypothetical protein
MTVTNTLAYYDTKLIRFNVKNAMSLAVIVESHKGATLWKAPALPVNIRLGQK